MYFPIKCENPPLAGQDTEVMKKSLSYTPTLADGARGEHRLRKSTEISKRVFSDVSVAKRC